MDKVILGDDSIVHINLEGEISGALAKEIVEELQTHSIQLEMMGKPIKASVFLDSKGDADRDAREILVEALKTIQFEKLAFWGGNIFTENTTRFLLMVAGVKKNITFAKTEKEALNWLTVSDV
jgi:prephenate dehydratase